MKYNVDIRRRGLRFASGNRASAEPVMGAHADARGEDDLRHAGAEGEMHGVVGRELLRREHRRQDRHQGHATADAEQPGEKADEGAGREVGEQPGVEHRTSIAAASRAAAARPRTYVVRNISP